MTNGRDRSGPARERIGAYIGFRSPVGLKRMLEKAASENGRSISSEAQFRLEQSFRDDRVLEAIRHISDKMENP